MTSGTIDDEKVHEWLTDIASSAWVSLHYESPSLNGLGRGEVSGGGYVRRLITFTTPSNRAIWSLDDARFSGLLAVRLTHYGIWNKQAAGKLNAYGELPPDISGLIRPGGGFLIKAGKIAVSIA